MRKADTLSKKYFGICSWNCESANRRGDVLKKMVYDFDVIRLQETRTCLNRPLVLKTSQSFRGIKAIVVWSDVIKT